MFYWFKKKKFYVSFKGKLFLIKISVGENLEKKNKLCKFLKNKKKLYNGGKKYLFVLLVILYLILVSEFF